MRIRTFVGQKCVSLETGLSPRVLLFRSSEPKWPRIWLPGMEAAVRNDLYVGLHASLGLKTHGTRTTADARPEKCWADSCDSALVRTCVGTDHVFVVAGCCGGPG